MHRGLASSAYSPLMLRRLDTVTSRPEHGYSFRGSLERKRIRGKFAERVQPVNRTPRRFSFIVGTSISRRRQAEGKSTDSIWTRNNGKTVGDDDTRDDRTPKLVRSVPTVPGVSIGMAKRSENSTDKDKRFVTTRVANVKLNAKITPTDLTMLVS